MMGNPKSVVIKSSLCFLGFHIISNCFLCYIQYSEQEFFFMDPIKWQIQKG